MAGETPVRIVGSANAPGRSGRPPPTTTVAPLATASSTCSIRACAARSDDSRASVVAGAAGAPRVSAAKRSRMPHERVVVLVDHDEALGRHAALAHVLEAALDRRVDRAL